MFRTREGARARRLLPLGQLEQFVYKISIIRSVEAGVVTEVTKWRPACSSQIENLNALLPNTQTCPEYLTQISLERHPSAHLLHYNEISPNRL